MSVCILYVYMSVCIYCMRVPPVAHRYSIHTDIYCMCVCTSCHATSAHLPDDESIAVDISHDVRLEVIFVQALVQDLRGHVAPCPNTCAQRDVHFIGVAMATVKRASAAV